MSHDQLIVSVNTVWVLIAATLVLLMQPAFALLESGLGRARNAAHLAVTTIVVLATCFVAYWLVGFGLAFGDRAPGAGSTLAGWMGTSGFVPSAHDLLARGASPFSYFSRVPTAAGWYFQAGFAAVSVAIAFGGMAERARMLTYVGFAAAFTVIYSMVSHMVWHADGWLFKLGMQDFAGSTVVHYQGALAALAGTLVLGARRGRFGARNSLMPAHNLVYVVVATLLLWVGWMGFNPGSTLGIEAGGLGFSAYVALTTNLGAAAGLLGAMATSWLLLRRIDVAGACNGVLAALVAITAACGFVAPWAAVVIGLVSGVIAVAAPPLIERVRVDDPVGAIAVHGLAGVWGTLATGLFAMPSLAASLGVGRPGLVYGGGFHQLGVQALGLLATGAFGFTSCVVVLVVLKAVAGVRVSAHAEVAGLDHVEHGAAAYVLGELPVQPVAEPAATFAPGRSVGDVLAARDAAATAGGDARRRGEAAIAARAAAVTAALAEQPGTLRARGTA